MSKISNMLKMLIILNNRDKVTITELANELEVSKKQIQRYRSDLDMNGFYIHSISGPNGGYNLIDKGIMITYDTEDQIEIDQKTINIIPAWKWLLEG